MWNTGISRVYNNAPIELNWNDLETDNDWFGELSGQIPSGHNGKLAVVAPWCSNSYEIATKAIAFYTDPGPKSPVLYVFQNYLDNQIYYVSAEDPEAGSNLWASKQWCGDGPSRYVNLSIGLQGETFRVTANAVG